MREFSLRFTDSEKAPMLGTVHDNGRVILDDGSEFDGVNDFQRWLNAQSGLLMEASDDEVENALNG